VRHRKSAARESGLTATDRGRPAFGSIPGRTPGLSRDLISGFPRGPDPVTTKLDLSRNYAFGSLVAERFWPGSDGCDRLALCHFVKDKDPAAWLEDVRAKASQEANTQAHWDWFYLN